MTEASDLPLFEAAPRGPARIPVPHRRRAISAVAGLLVAALAATSLAPPRPRLVWNASASSPVGLYWVTPDAALARGDRVVAWPPPAARTLAAARHYLPGNVPLVKRVAALPGDRICGDASALRINGRRVAARLQHDARGRPLVAWRGCRTLAGNALLLLADAPASYDGRYFGASRNADIVGKATPLWLR